MPDNYSWLQLARDILFPLSSTLAGAGIAYLATMKSAEKQRKLNEREQALKNLDRVYELLQEVEAHARYCLHEYPNIAIISATDPGKIRNEIISRVRSFNTMELDRLIELNFGELKELLSETKTALRKLSLLFRVSGGFDSVKLNGAYESLEPKVSALMEAVAIQRRGIVDAPI